MAFITRICHSARSSESQILITDSSVKNARHNNPKKDAVRKAVRNKTKRKTKNEMAGCRVHGPEKDGYKRMERQSKEPRDLEAYCNGGQGPPRAVAPSDDDDDDSSITCRSIRICGIVMTREFSGGICCL